MRAKLERRPGVVYNFSQPIKDRVEESISGIRGQVVVKIYGEDLDAHAREAGRSEAHPARRRAARATSRSTGPAARSTWSPTSTAKPPRASACACATSRTRIETAYGGQLATSVWEGERRSACASSCRSPDEGDAAQRRAARHPGAGRQGGRVRVPLAVAGQPARRPRAHADQPRAGRALPGHQVQHRGARHGQLRRRGAGARAARGEAARGLLPDLGRRVREPAPRDGAPGGHRAGLGRSRSSSSST